MSRDVTLTFDVEDTGIGLAPEDQARIFGPFVQGGGVTKRTGLGLSISETLLTTMLLRRSRSTAPDEQSKP